MTRRRSYAVAPQQQGDRAMKEYLGDGVYAEFTGWDILLTTEDGRSVTNRIHLEPQVYAALKRLRHAALEREGGSTGGATVKEPDITTPPAESDIADAILNAPSGYHRLTIRRLAFQRDMLLKIRTSLHRYIEQLTQGYEETQEERR